VSGFLFAFLAVLVVGAAARDQVLVAMLARIQGPRPLLLATALLAAALTTAFAGWAAARLAAELGPPFRAALASVALVVAGGEMVLVGPARRPAEPTRSLFAALLVLAAFQVSDAARLLVLAFGVSTAAPIPAALGGVAASWVLLAAAWLAPGAVLSRALARARRWAGGGVLLLGFFKLIA